MKNFMNKIGFSEEEQAFASELLSSFDDSVFVRFKELKDIYFMKNTVLSQIECRDHVGEQLKEMSKHTNCHEYSMNLAFLLCCYDDLKALYEKAGIDPSFFYDIARDLATKLHECRMRYGIIGISSFNWFHRHFLMKLFALGRLQYVKMEFSGDNPYVFEDITINPGDDVYYIHIPSNGPLTEETRYDSYKKAFKFFGKKKGEHIFLCCASWILYPENKLIFPENSNLMGFFNDFDIIKSYDDVDPFPDAWRIFGRDYDGDVSLLKQETSLQKNFAAWLKKDGKTGKGLGVIIFDGERIINKKR